MKNPTQRTCIVCQRGFLIEQSRLKVRSADYCSKVCLHSEKASILRFWAKVLIGKDDDCWIWRGARLPRGYGHITWRMKTESAHRVAWRIAFGDIPGDLHVLHRCDNPSCVNPNHLWLGTASDNIKDGVRKGRIIPPKRATSSSS